MRPQDDADGEAEEALVGIVQSHAHHVVLRAGGNQQLLTHREVLQQHALEEKHRIITSGGKTYLLSRLTNGNLNLQICLS